MNVTLIVGYRATELGIFRDNDERINIIKKVIRKDIIKMLDNGVEWFIFLGNLGFEYWVLEILLSLKQDYKFKMASFICFENQGQNWSLENQEKLSKFKTLNFVKYFYDFYRTPVQLKIFIQNDAIKRWLCNTTVRF